jgi:type I restriction enzyme M protein
MASNLVNSFKRIDDALWVDGGANNPGDYITQISWMLFLKYLEDLESRRQIDAQLGGGSYTPILKEEFQWHSWACPKTADGKKDVSKALSGKDLLDFVNNELFPYLKAFKNTTEDTKTLMYKIGEVFSEIDNKIQGGHTLREALDIIDMLEFKTQDQLDDLSHLYEDRLKMLGGAGKSGEYYTPRPLIKTIIKALDLEPGKTIYDSAAGTAGFLTEAYDFLKVKNLSAKQLKYLKEETFTGKNKMAQPYLLGTMNMILHGIEAPNMIHTNTLTEDTADIQEKDRYDYILANPPFGGKEHAEVQRNFPIKTGATELLFLQHFMKRLRAGGQAAIVIKNTFLSNTDNATTSVRKELLETCDLHTVMDLPGGAFSANSSTGVKTVVLFFEKGKPTKKTWYYQLDVGRSLGKTDPLNENDFTDFLNLYKKEEDSPKSWSVKIADVEQKSFDLSVKNPNAPEEAALRSPKEIIKSLHSLDKEAVKILNKLE